MINTRKLWLWLGAIFLLSFTVLGLLGRDIYVQAPPVPEKVVTADGTTIYTRADIESGREVWQTLGGMELNDNFGQVTRIYFSKHERNPKLPASLFTFTPPPGADVIGE